MSPKTFSEVLAVKKKVSAKKAEKIKCQNCGVLISDKNETAKWWQVQLYTAKQIWCDACYREEADACAVCENIFSLESMVEVDAGFLPLRSSGETARVCINCREAHFTTCAACDTVFHRTLMSHGGTSDYCEGCADEQSEDDFDDNAIHQYDYEPSLIFYKLSDEPDDVLHIGMEVEVNTPEHSTCDHDEEYAQKLLKEFPDRTVYVKEDGSVYPGFEIVTMPHSIAAMKQLWINFFNRPQSKVRSKLNGFKTRQCGVHVHIERAKLTEAQLRRMIVFLNAPENTRFVGIVAQRGTNSYCVIKPKKYEDPFTYDKYEALSTRSNRTVELRIFKGTFKLERLLKNIEFTQALIELSKCVDYQCLTVDTMVKYIYSNEIAFPNLVNFLNERWTTEVQENESITHLNFTTE